MVDGYCFRCRRKVGIREAGRVTLGSGRPAAYGGCPVCGAAVFRILSDKEAEMALYEYRCTYCKADFEARRPMDEVGETAECPECGSEGRRLTSVFASGDQGRLRTPDGEALRRQEFNPEVLEDLRRQTAGFRSELGELSARSEQLSQQVEEWRRKEGALTRHVGELEERRGSLEAQVADLEQRGRQAESLGQEVEALERRREQLRANVDEWYDREERLRRRAGELEQEAEQRRREAGEAGAELESRRRELSEVSEGARESGAEVERLRQERERLLGEQESLKQEVERWRRETETARSGVESKRQELQQVQREVSECRTEVERLQEAHQQAASAVPGVQEQAAAYLQRAGEDAAASVREGAQSVRKELDSLFQEAMDLSSRAAQIDADIRSHEWVNRLLALMEGKDEVNAQQFRALALTLLGAFAQWMDTHQDDASPRAREEVGNLVETLQGTGA